MTTRDAIDISGIDKAELLAALYNRAKPQGLGFLHYTPQDMTPEEARQYLEVGDDLAQHFPSMREARSPMYFDYLNGRVMKVEIGGDTLDTWSYNRDNGDGAAEAVINSLRG